MRKTATALLIEHKLGRSLAADVELRRAHDLSWRRIAEQLTKETGIEVSHESLRSWFPDLRAPLRDTA